MEIKKIFDSIDVQNGYSLTSKHFSLSPIFQPLAKKQIHRDLYKKIQDNTINELLVTKSYDTKDYTINLSMIEMNNKTDELLFLTLIGLNRTYIEITLKDLAQLMHFGKESGKEKTKDRLMDSVNKLLKCSININFKHTDDSYGFHILKYKYNQADHEEQKTLKIWFDLDFINLYNSSNISLIDTKIFKSLKSDYAKTLFSLINNFSTETNQFEFNKKVLHEKFGVEKLDKNQKERIKKGLQELKEHGIIHTFSLLKDDTLKIKKAEVKYNTTNIQTREEKKVSKIKKNINKQAEQHKENILELPEGTEKELEIKFNMVKSIATNPHNGLTITEHVKMNKEYDRLKKIFVKEQKEVIIKEVENKKTEEELDEIMFNIPKKGRSNRTVSVIKCDTMKN